MPSSDSSHPDFAALSRRIRACNYLTVAQLFLMDNFLLERPLAPADIKPRLLGHWGTCPGINLAYANLRSFFGNDPNFSFILGPGHGFPALQANLFIDGNLAEVDPRATRDLPGLSYLCKSFSWPGGFPSHASPFTPGVICEGGELGYALGIAYGAALGHPSKTFAVLLGDGELETATALASLNLVKLLASPANGWVLPILHLNSYKISGPTVYGRKSERALHQLFRGFGFTPLDVTDSESFQSALLTAQTLHAQPSTPPPLLILRTAKGATGPDSFAGQKITGNYLSHQIPLPLAKTDPAQLQLLETWLKSYQFNQLFNPEKGFTL